MGVKFKNCPTPSTSLRFLVQMSTELTDPLGRSLLCDPNKQQQQLKDANTNVQFLHFPVKLEEFSTAFSTKYDDLTLFENDFFFLT